MLTDAPDDEWGVFASRFRTKLGGPCLPTPARTKDLGDGSEAVAQAFENTKDLPQEVSRVTLRDIAGAGFEPATFGL